MYYSAENFEECKLLYHYTSLEGFERIVKNGYIALTDITKSNDPAEGRFALVSLDEAYKKLYRYGEINYDTFDKLRKIYFDFAGSETTFERLQHAVLSVSFCEPDLPLALWRSYGDNGKGVCFSISKDDLKKQGEQYGCKFDKIQYLTENEMVDKSMQFWKDNMDKTDDVITELLMEFYIDGYFIKRAENKYEREWRLVYTGVVLSDYLVIPRQVPEQLDVFMREDDMVIFYKIPIKPERIIDHICIGPQCKVTENEMRFFLSKYEVDFCGVHRDGVVMR